MRKWMIALVAACLLTLPACRAALDTKGMGASAGVDWPPKVEVGLSGPKVEVGADNPLAPLFNPAPLPPAPDPVVLSRLEAVQAALAKAEADGSKSAEEIAALRAEVASLRAEEEEAPGEPKPVPQVVAEKAPGILAKLVSGQVAGAALDIVALALLIFGGAKANRKWKSSKQKREARLAALEKKAGVQP